MGVSLESTSTGAETHPQHYEGEISDDDRANLRIVADSLPRSVWLVTIVEFCERFAFYGLSGPFQNYIQNSGNSLRPGVIGLGQAHATCLNQFFMFWCNITPIFGAIIADQYLGRFNTIVYHSLVYILGLIVLFATSLPVSIHHGAALGGLITAMILIGLGTGGIKSNVSPLVAEQYTGKKQFIRKLKSGERVIVDPNITIQRIYTTYYVCVSIGSLSSIATTNMELYIDFWAAYLLPLLMFLAGFGILLFSRKFYVTRPPKRSVIPHAFKAMWIGLINKGNMDAAKPLYSEKFGQKYTTPWDNLFIDELKRALVACRVFLFFPFYWVSYGQMLNNLITQAGTMETHGVPNDFMQNISVFPIIVLAPIFDRLVYPAMRKMGIAFKPITRITWGFILAALAMAYTAVVQHIIYASPPCYDTPLASTCLDGLVPNKVHVVVQTPAYLLLGISEIFTSITGLEYAYTKAPPSMKSFVTSIFLLTLAFGPAIGIALTPVTVDPKLLWLYTGLAIMTFITSCIFWVLFRKYNKTEENMNALDAQDSQVAVFVVLLSDENSVGARREDVILTGTKLKKGGTVRTSFVVFWGPVAADHLSFEFPS
ncbi:peptide transport protein PTR2 [Wilcoxina mikolae CBS 423.85]|nr:peptide transport protein PTR2 [Wilcoxina mikolae CBS 423.85]